MSHYIIGLTGGIGSGKTTIANMFAELGVDVIDADIIARQVVEPNTPALIAIQQRFGADMLTADGQLNRGLLRTKVFNNEEDKSWLNNLLHPLIRQQMQSQTLAAQSPYCLLVIPLLIENNLTAMVNRVLVIDVDEQTQLQRASQRDNNSTQLIQNIINSQIDRQSRLSHADDIIDNQHLSLNEIKSLIVKLHHKYLQLAAQFQ
ncbi:dephospho-CoA kinase [Thalassotalea agariperforans]